MVALLTPVVVARVSNGGLLLCLDGLPTLRELYQFLESSHRIDSGFRMTSRYNGVRSKIIAGCCVIPVGDWWRYTTCRDRTESVNRAIAKPSTCDGTRRDPRCKWQWRYTTGLTCSDRTDSVHRAIAKPSTHGAHDNGGTRQASLVGIEQSPCTVWQLRRVPTVHMTMTVHDFALLIWSFLDPW